ncbi:alpha-D-mannose-specific plant lectins domain-containing protein [Dioscorea alata]|uniref:Alpha-D-mannose-specific plant lectins domain-containing protein n=1 Tax=Dioscorea alata TaxID=55571 RepID=A0ACB7W3N9_DIOAL|nr:alpha-D-mannose-specific plant lectins domain-containing protein [Dioscorea alata]
MANNIIPSLSLTVPLIFILLSIISTSSKAQVPSDQQFKYVNEGEFGPYITEYGADYRMLPLGTSPFQMGFYNTTPGAFYLALRMGTTRAESLFRWVWEANRGFPVAENATFSLLRNGNLVLAEADGKLVWSSQTANKGVVGFKILPNGNIVLYNRKGQFIWQSFDHPTDTLLAGQSLRRTGSNKLVSRSSAVDGSFGKYSLVLEYSGLSMYIDNTIPYYNHSTDGYLSGTPPLNSILFTTRPETDEAYAYEVSLDIPSGGNILLARPKYNATLSILRLEVEGNLAVYTYYDPVDYRAWEKTFAFFSDEIGRVDGCRLPSKCGVLGVCEEEMCVACPTDKGLMGWSKKCAPPVSGSGCSNGASVRSSNSHGYGYYKVEGVENYLTMYNEGEGKVGFDECQKRCSKDCKCEGFLFWEETSQCWLAQAIGTLTKVSNAKHLAYIKKSSK